MWFIAAAGDTNTFASIQAQLLQQGVHKSATLPANQSLGGFYDEVRIWLMRSMNQMNHLQMPMYALETPDGRRTTLRTLGAYLSLSPPATMNGAKTMPVHQV